MIGPIIFVTVVHGIAGMRDMRSVGRLALKSLIYFEVITILALIVGLVVVDVWKPGAGMNIDPATLDSAAVADYAAYARRRLDDNAWAYLDGAAGDELTRRRRDGALAAHGLQQVHELVADQGVALALGAELVAEGDFSHGASVPQSHV